MSFARGATLTTATTLGHADTSDLGPTAGNGFYTRWPDDLALLQDLGVTDLRLTIDWARLQPRPGDLDEDWAERFDNFLNAAEAIELRLWAALHDGAIPRWLDNEGGLDDADTVTQWWPRWVERVADRFGDRLSGWVPFARIPDGLPLQAWRDTWGILRGADAPVVAVVGTDDAAAIERYVGLTSHLGIALATEVRDDDTPSEEELLRTAERITESIHATADVAQELPVVISEFSPHHNDPDVNGQLVEQFVCTVDATIADGVDVVVGFLDPAIAGPDGPVGLLDKDRSPQPAATAFLHR